MHVKGRTLVSNPRISALPWQTNAKCHLLIGPITTYWTTFNSFRLKVNLRRSTVNGNYLGSSDKSLPFRLNCKITVPDKIVVKWVQIPSFLCIFTPPQKRQFDLVAHARFLSHHSRCYPVGRVKIVVKWVALFRLSSWTFIRIPNQRENL